MISATDRASAAGVPIRAVELDAIDVADVGDGGNVLAAAGVLEIYGQLGAVVLRRGRPGRFFAIAGAAWIHAARRLGRREIGAVVLDVGRSEAVRLRAELDGPPRLIGMAEMADLLGCSERSVARKISAGEVPEPIRIGGRPKWPADELGRWFASGCPERETWEAWEAIEK